MTQQRFPKQTLNAKVNGMSKVGRPRTRWFNHIEDMDWNHSRLCSSKMQSVLVDVVA